MTAERILNPIQSDLEVELSSLPDLTSNALLEWRKATLNREKREALLYLEFRNTATGRTVKEIEAMVDSDGGRYDAKLAEAVAEAHYHKLYEKLMSSKKLADLRTAF